MNTRTALFEQYGPLLTYVQLAKVLNRSAEGLKASMGKARQHSEASRLLATARLRIGKRVYFRTEQIADLLEHDAFAVKAEGREGGV